MKNQVFDWSRFVLALRKEVVENWRQLALAMAVLYVAMTILMLLGNWVTSGSERIEDVFARYTMVFVVFSLSSIVMASLSFRGLMTKTSRTELLTSPSSMTEKFTVNVLIYVVGYVIAFFVVTQLADLTRVVLLWGARSEEFNVPGPINFLPMVQRFTSGELQLVLGRHELFRAAIYVGLVASAGLYVLASVLWPRYSFLKMFAATYVIEMAIFIVGIVVLHGFGSFKEFVLMVADRVTNGTFAMAMLVAAIVQLVLFWVLAWAVFRRKDMVSRGVFH